MPLLKLFLFLALSLQASAGAQLDELSHLPPLDKNLLLFLGIQSGIPYTPPIVNKCPKDTPAQWAPQTCSIKSYLYKHIKPFDEVLKKTASARVIYFGETHNQQGAKTLLKDLLPHLKEQGFSTLALEMFNSSQQIILDNYLQGHIKLADVEF